MRLNRETTGQTLVPNLVVAKTLWQRNKGLLGRERLPEGEALWILRCNSIHTFFMRFAIDLIFLDSKMSVRKTVGQVKPGRVVLPVWRASSVVELPAGFLSQHELLVGEKLNVDPALS